MIITGKCSQRYHAHPCLTTPKVPENTLSLTSCRSLALIFDLPPSHLGLPLLITGSAYLVKKDEVGELGLESHDNAHRAFQSPQTMLTMLYAALNSSSLSSTRCPPRYRA
ncbi:hypothetical protein PQX77_002693, partial [Marasmius sp. AFHP31]